MIRSSHLREQIEPLGDQSPSSKFVKKHSEQEQEELPIQTLDTRTSSLAATPGRLLSTRPGLCAVPLRTVAEVLWWTAPRLVPSTWH